MLFPAVQTTCERLSAQFDSIPEDRKAVLHQLAIYIQQSIVRSDHQTASVIVICTHNSRRSHMGQLWLQIAADFYGLEGLETFSGGTEATAFNPNAVQAMRSLGLQIEVHQPGDNPVYACQWTESGEPYLAFSTRFDEAPNPTSGFLAIMVCTDADEACPFVPGAAGRLSLPFEDPKAFDGTDLQDAKYLERAEQIGSQMLYVLSRIV